MNLRRRIGILVLAVLAATVLLSASAGSAQAAQQASCPGVDGQVPLSTGVQLAACIAEYNQMPSGTELRLQLDSFFRLDDAVLPPINNPAAEPPLLVISGTDTINVGTALTSRSGVLIRQLAGNLRVEKISAFVPGTAYDIEGGSFALSQSSVVFSHVAVSVGSNATVIVENSSIAANSRGIVVSGGHVTVSSSSLVSNSQGAIVATQPANVSLVGSLVAANNDGDCVGQVTVTQDPATQVATTQDAGNVFGDDSCTGVATPNLLGTFTTCVRSCGRYIQLQPGSPAIDAYPGCGAGLVDQRGFKRPAGACDAGSFEVLDLCNFVPVTIDMNLNGGDGTGTPGDDVIKGTPGDDVILGGAGNDTVCAGDGNDHVQGGHGNDTLLGEDGDDRLFGAQGDDRLDGSNGNDTLHGNRGSDVLIAGRGDDRVYGYAGDDEIFGNGGADSLHGNGGDDLIEGGADDDLVFGYAGNDRLQGGQGNDVLRGHFGDDTIAGGGGADVLVGSADNDTLGGGNGNDIVQGNSGDDAVNGGWGDDELDGGIGTDACDGVAGFNTATRCETTQNLGG